MASASLQYLKGVGPARAEAFARIGIHTAEDLVTYFPRDWQDRRFRFSIREAPMGEKVALRGTILSAQFSMTRSNLGVATVLMEDRSGRIHATWFKKTTPRYDVFASLRQSLIVGRSLCAYGPIEFGPQGRQVGVEDALVLETAESTLSTEDQFHFGRIVPVYTTPDMIPERLLRSLIGRVVAQTNSIDTDVPLIIQKRLGLQPKTWAIRSLHFPDTLIQKEDARRILAFEEFFVLETALALVRQQVKHHIKPHRHQLKRTLLTPFRQALGFEFTNAQKRVIREIFEDMASPRPMNRLLQGDVGSGKTLVALSAMLLAVENGGQAVLMAPTEILAEQHALTLGRFLKHLPVQCALLTGKQPPALRKQCLKEIAAGSIQLVIGTHALIEKAVTFSKLTLAVIDEQHRFGVGHRRLLREKGSIPDVLVMTATPIPRTLALTVYGDLDVSVVDELPPGRSPITTRHVGEEEAYRMIQNTLAAGQQAYLIYPLVKESDKLELKAVEQEAQRLRRTVFKEFQVGVLHGQLSSRDKESIMEKFRSRAIHVLIATTIVEVGIDIPNATMMVVQHAERFGLSTLHQLRGRVGRGSIPSHCLLIADMKTDDARKRIQIMTHIRDGFRLSEEDLKLRGPGEVMGVAQHGIPEFRLGRMMEDVALIQSAKQCAEELLITDPLLKSKENALLRRTITRQYGTHWNLGIMG